MEQLKTYTMTQHLNELRTRIIKIFILWCIATLICFYFSEELFNILTKPMMIFDQDRKFIFTGLTEGFITYTKLSLITGLLVTLPYIGLHIYQFILPALYQHETKIIVYISILSLLLFISAIIIVYYFIIPFAFNFFLNFEFTKDNNIAVILQARISEYLSTIIHLFFSFIVMFQMPVILITLLKLKFLDIKSLQKYRNY